MDFTYTGNISRFLVSKFKHLRCISFFIEIINDFHWHAALLDQDSLLLCNSKQISMI